MISVILPVLNAADTLPDQLGALASQSFRGSWELVIADNGSTDGSPDIIRNWRDRLPLIFVEASGTTGGAAARNLAAKWARGEVLVSCDADDVVDVDWLEALAAAASEHGFVAGALDYFTLNPHAPRWKREMLLGPTHWLGRIPFADSANLAVRKAAFDSIGGFDASLSTVYDVDFSVRLAQSGHELHFAPRAIVAKRMRRGLSAIWSQSAQWGRDEVVIYKRYRDSSIGPGVVRTRGAEHLKVVASHLSRLPASFTAASLTTAWVEFAARHCGRLRGSLEQRMFLP